MSTSKHTEAPSLPWKLNESLASGAKGYEVTDFNGNEIFDSNEFSCEAPTLERARFIVDCVNRSASPQQATQRADVKAAKRLSEHLAKEAKSEEVRLAQRTLLDYIAALEAQPPAAPAGFSKSQWEFTLRMARKVSRGEHVIEEKGEYQVYLKNFADALLASLAQPPAAPECDCGKGKTSCTCTAHSPVNTAQPAGSELQVFDAALVEHFKDLPEAVADSYFRILNIEKVPQDQQRSYLLTHIKTHLRSAFGNANNALAQPVNKGPSAPAAGVEALEAAKNVMMTVSGQISYIQSGLRDQDSAKFDEVLTILRNGFEAAGIALAASQRPKTEPEVDDKEIANLVLEIRDRRVGDTGKLLGHVLSLGEAVAAIHRLIVVHPSTPPSASAEEAAREIIGLELEHGFNNFLVVEGRLKPIAAIIQRAIDGAVAEKHAKVQSLSARLTPAIFKLAAANKRADELVAALSSLLERLKFKNTDEAKHYSKDDAFWIELGEKALTAHKAAASQAANDNQTAREVA